MVLKVDLSDAIVCPLWVIPVDHFRVVEVDLPSTAAAFGVSVCLLSN